MIVKPKGTKDVLPSDVYLWHRIEDAARKSAETYGFREIRTPVFEYTELFSRGVGDGTDVVRKEMYTFPDKGGRSLTLRPEGTAGVARAFVENSLAGGAMPFKGYYLISAFRYERPQAGRLREFHQFGAELYGAAGPAADAEVICLADGFLKKTGLRQYALQINSIGCPVCRKRYGEALKEYFVSRLNEMCEDCRERFERNPMRILDCKVEGCGKITANAPHILDFLCSDCFMHFEEVKMLLQSAGVRYEVNPRIVRGLDYYSRTVFEFVSENAGAQGTLLGGGRYDGLLEQIGEKSVPAVGFAAGIERLILALEAEDKADGDGGGCTVYLAGMNAATRTQAFLLAKVLREAGVSCEVDLMERSVKSQFKYADKRGARYVAVLGENELQSGVVEVKNMKNSSVERVELDSIAQYFIDKEN